MRLNGLNYGFSFTQTSNHHCERKNEVTRLCAMSMERITISEPWLLKCEWTMCTISDEEIILIFRHFLFSYQQFCNHLMTPLTMVKRLIGVLQPIFLSILYCSVFTARQYSSQVFKRYSIASLREIKYAVHIFIYKNTTTSVSSIVYKSHVPSICVWTFPDARVNIFYFLNIYFHLFLPIFWCCILFSEFCWHIQLETSSSYLFRVLMFHISASPAAIIIFLFFVSLSVLCETFSLLFSLHSV